VPYESVAFCLARSKNAKPRAFASARLERLAEGEARNAYLTFLIAQLFEKGGEVRDIQHSKTGCLIVTRLGLVALVGALSNITQRRVAS